MTLTFRIPTPPSVNMLFANAPGRGRIKSERYRVWSRDAQNHMRYAENRANSWPTLSCPVAVEISLGSVRGDIDNRSKAALDLLVDMAVITDDVQVDELVITRAAGDPKFCTISVRPLCGEAVQ